MSWEYEDSRYWDTVYTSEEEYLDEKVVTEGNDGEDEFDRRIHEAIRDKVVLDVGCGTAEFTLEMADGAKKVEGVDFSPEAISRAEENVAKSAKNNVTVRLANATSLPFPDESFDLVICRRGPVADTMETLLEAHRVLKKGGRLMEITIGERDKQNLAEIFRRGQMYDVSEKVSLSKQTMLKKAGFHVIEVKDYIAAEIFATIQDLTIRLKNSPIIADFDVDKDKKALDLIESRFRTAKGIVTRVHRVTIVAEK